MIDGRQLYEQHRLDCAEWGLDVPLPEWLELSVEDRAGWELLAADSAEKWTTDRKESS